MNKTKPLTILLILLVLSVSTAQSLQPEEILIIANIDNGQSIQLAQYYCSKRNVPQENIIALPLGKNLPYTISRKDYEILLAEPLRKKLAEEKFSGKIKALVTTYAVPVKVRGRGTVSGKEKQLAKLQQQAQAIKQQIQNQQAQQQNAYKVRILKSRQVQTQASINYIKGKETSASLDSELSMVLFRDYELFRWQPNKLNRKSSYWDFKTLMVARLDGPSVEIAKGLIDKAINTELKGGLKGRAYIDSRGMKKNDQSFSMGYYDQSMRDTVKLLESFSNMPVKSEDTEMLFQPGDCPDTAVYCGWYSLKKYIDAFDFVEGAIGYHIASWEAVDLRDINSTQWCPAMLKDGVTATIGAVDEPYLNAFCEPKEFFAELLSGSCLAEAYYHTSPYNSWQMVLIGDPLYTPFPNPQKK